MKLVPDMYQLNIFNITKIRVSMNGWVGKFNQKTTRKCHEIKRNLTLTFKTSLENAKEMYPYSNQKCTFLLLVESIIFLHIASFLWSFFFCKTLQHPQINPGSAPNSFKNCDWIYVHVDGSALDEVVSLVYSLCGCNNWKNFLGWV